jgi:ABC transporter.
MMNEEAKKYLSMVGLDISPKTIVGDLSVGQQQMVEIAKALSINAKIIVMDEPTSSLSEKEVQILFDTVRKLKSQGVSIIYISHKMEEIFELTDRIIVMRDGNYVGTKITRETNREELIPMMVGRELKNYYVRTYNKIGEPVLKVKDISVEGKVYNCGFEVKKGEILGFYGLIGAGRSELMEAIIGLLPQKSGEVYINGQQYKNLTPL